MVSSRTRAVRQVQPKRSWAPGFAFMGLALVTKAQGNLNMSDCHQDRCRGSPFLAGVPPRQVSWQERLPIQNSLCHGDHARFSLRAWRGLSMNAHHRNRKRQLWEPVRASGGVKTQSLRLYPPTSASPQMALLNKLCWPFKRKFVFHARLWGKTRREKAHCCFLFSKEMFSFKPKAHELSIMTTVALKTWMMFSFYSFCTWLSIDGKYFFCSFFWFVLIIPFYSSHSVYFPR